VIRFYPVLLLTMLFSLATLQAEEISTVPQTTLELPPGKENPRNSEGDFIRLKDGSLLFVYTHFTTGAGDHANAFLAGRVSQDEGQTWTANDRVVVANEGGFNIMSVSLLRLDDGRIALFYLRKNSLEDCRPILRFSNDEAQTWSDPVETVPDKEVGYYVLNNDRALQIRNGRIILPLAQHFGPGQEKWTAYANAVCYLSDDGGQTWKRSHDVPGTNTAAEKPVMIQEPGLVELKNGHVMMFARTNAGSQYLSYSNDRGETWSEWKSSDILSPRSPATMERIPSTGDLLLVWNNHDGIDPSLAGKRTPLTAAISQDEGNTWRHIRNLADNPHGWYCYTALVFVDDHVILGHCAGDRRNNNGLAESHITRVPLEWFYQKAK